MRRSTRISCGCGGGCAWCGAWISMGAHGWHRSERSWAHRRHGQGRVNAVCRREITVTVLIWQWASCTSVRYSRSYKFVDLPRHYALEGESPDSASIREDLRLTVGFNARVDLTLNLVPWKESVTVTDRVRSSSSRNDGSVRSPRKCSIRFARRDLQNVLHGPGSRGDRRVGGSTMRRARTVPATVCCPSEAAG